MAHKKAGGSSRNGRDSAEAASAPKPAAKKAVAAKAKAQKPSTKNAAPAKAAAKKSPKAK